MLRQSLVSTILDGIGLSFKGEKLSPANIFESWDFTVFLTEELFRIEFDILMNVFWNKKAGWWLEKKNPFNCSVLVKKFIISQKWPQKKPANESSIFYYLWESSGTVLSDRTDVYMYQWHLTKKKILFNSTFMQASDRDVNNCFHKSSNCPSTPNNNTII